MSEVLLLSDNFVFGNYGATRYIGPYVLASQLETAGISCQVIDFFTRHSDFFSYIDQFLSPDLKVVGISSTFLFPAEKAKASKGNRSDGVTNYYSGDLWFNSGDELLRWTQELKNKITAISPDCKLVLGGVKAQFAHWRPEYYQHFDHVFFGAADQSFIEYCQSNKSKNLKIESTERFIYQSEPMKNQNLCPVCHFQNKWGIQVKESLPIEISRGWLFNCKFCHYEKKKSDKKDISQLKNEMIRNYELFGTTVYHFCDDCFNDTRKKVEDVCQMFLSLPFKIDWVSYARVDVAVKFNETLDLMLASGARGLYWGIESFKYEAALAAGKGTHPDLVKDLFIRYRSRFKNQCLAEASFIIGLPGDDEASLNGTYKWLVENDVFDFVTFGALGLMPYTENFDKLIFDYADYSRNPEKYGFTKIEFSPKRYWEHHSMNSEQAHRIATQFSGAYRNHTQRANIFGTIWMYPHLRTLGYTHEQIISFLNQPVDIEKNRREIVRRFDGYLETYFQDIKKDMM